MSKIGKFLCKWLGWHVPDNRNITFDGCSMGSRCLYCKKRILQDSQGNWFLIGVE